MPVDPDGAREVDLGLLIADLCGYTALTEAHGALHASEVVLRFGRLVEANLEPGVRIIDCIGDDVLCAGPDILAVVRTALRLRQAIRDQPNFLDVRTGIHHGRMVEREGRLFGSPINLVARVAGHAQGGQILCTEPVAHAVRGAGGLETRELGKKRFKNVAHRVAVFELTSAVAPKPASAVDPVCRMQVEVDRAAATIAYAGSTYCFCSLECSRIFAQAPELYVAGGGG
jgi:adenylate cyclase